MADEDPLLELERQRRRRILGAMTAVESVVSNFIPDWRTPSGEEAGRQIKEILDNSALSPAEKKRALKGVRRMFLRRDRESAEAERRVAEQEAVVATAKLALAEFTLWANSHPVLQRTESSMLPSLLKAAKERRVILLSEESAEMNDTLVEVLGNAEAFVVQHNWARALEKAEDFAEGEFKLPYPECCFELRFGGKAVVIVVSDDDHLTTWFVELSQGWLCAGYSTKENQKKVAMPDEAFAQVRAISIALEAEVAVSEVVRAPYRRNKPRVDKPQLPFFEYRTVTLAKRHRYELPRGEGKQARRRLHFRRGHWRHYEDHKTWINWMLVGDPDLGFIDKEYRL